MSAHVCLNSAPWVCVDTICQEENKKEEKGRTLSNALNLSFLSSSQLEVNPLHFEILLN